MQRPKKRRIFPFEESPVTELVGQVRKEDVPAAELAEVSLSTSQAQRKASSALKSSWESLTWREQQVSTLTCLGYTNRQIAARLYIRIETVKTHVSNARRKFNMHGKLEMQTAVKEWDFSEWA
jgi:DNA-binding NarL/FixJ family response regulator